MSKLDRPIVVIGMARAGTTVLAGMINWHSQVGPKLPVMEHCLSCQAFVDRLYGSSRGHTLYSSGMEHKAHFFKYFPGGQTWLHMGNDLICEDWKLTPTECKKLIEGVTRHWSNEPRFLCKSPSLTFVASLLPKLFGKGVKIICITRDFEGVDRSWRKQAPFGFKNRDILMGFNHTERLWNETKDYIQKLEDEFELDICHVNYSELLLRTGATMECVLNHCELPGEPYIYDVRLKMNRRV